MLTADHLLELCVVWCAFCAAINVEFCLKVVSNSVAFLCSLQKVHNVNVCHPCVSHQSCLVNFTLGGILILLHTKLACTFTNSLEVLMA